MGDTIDAADCELAARQERVLGFNRLLCEHCARLGVEYMDCFDEMTEGVPRLACSSQPTATTPPPHRPHTATTLPPYRPP